MQNSQTRTLCLNPTPIGSPTKIQPKIQVETFSSSASIASNTLRPSDNFSEQQPAGTRSMFSMNDKAEMWPHNSRKALGDTGTPRSLAPVSLEDLVRFKPGRGRNGKGGKWVPSLESDFDKDTNQELQGTFQTSDDNDNTVTPEMLLSQAFVPSQHSTHFQSNPAQLGMPRKPSFQTVPTSHQDDDFLLETLANGDLSVSQYSDTQNEWVALGQIDKSEVSFFTRFYDRSYSDNRANPENWKLYKAHIVATVKHLSEKRRKALQNWESTLEFRPGSVQHNSAPQQIHGSTQWSFQPRSIVSHQSSESFPPLPNSVQEFAASPESYTAGDAHPPLQPSRSSDRRQMLLSMFRSQSRDPIDMANKTISETSGHSAPRELKRSQTQENALLQRHQSDVANDDPYKREPIVSSVRHSPSTTPRSPPTPPLGMRRTVLHDPLKSRTHAANAALARFHSQPRLNVQRSQVILRSSLRHENIFSSHHSTPRALTANITPLQDLVRESGPDITPILASDRKVTSAPGLNSAFNFKEKDNDDSETCTYEDALDKFWYSGTFRYRRQMDIVDELRAESTEPWSKQAETGYRILIPLLGSLEEYSFSKKVLAAGGHDHFAPFINPRVP